MTASEAVEAFLAWCQVERALAKNTIAAYRLDLARFVEHAGPERDVRSLVADDVHGYLVRLARRGVGARSTTRHLASLRQLARYLMAEGEIAVDFARLVEAPKIPERLPEVPGPRDVRRLLRAPKVSTPRGLEHAAMLALLFSGGLRVSELASVRLRDVDLVRQLITVRDAKRGSDRTVPFGDDAARLLRQYIKRVRPKYAEPNTPHLFVSQKRSHYSRKHLWRIVKRYSALAGLEELSPHGLRHACATTLLRGGATLVEVAAQLGHRDLKNSQIYTRVDPEQLKREHRRCFPRG